MKKSPKEMDPQELLYELLADKIGSVDPKDVFFAKRIESGKSAGKYNVLIGGKKVSANRARNLIEEANTFRSMELYKLMSQTLNHEADLRMFKQAKTTEDMFFGKAILHSVGVWEAIINAIRNIDPTDIAQ